MRHKKKGNPLSRNTSHRKALLSNLVTSFFIAGKIRTTHAKAKEGQRLAEKMITLGKSGTLHARRQVLRIIRRQAVVKKLFDEIAPLYRERNGGYTRVTKLGVRAGDGALVSQLELIGATGVVGTGTAAKKTEKKSATSKAEPAAKGKAAVKGDA